jgi:hypothetical protein
MTSLSDKPAPFIYRNRSDDDRTPEQLHLCLSCGGYYGVPHTNSHCQKGETARWRPQDCACRFCREAMCWPIQGRFGVFLACTDASSVG